MFIPGDTKQMTEQYKINKGGICGQSCLAVIEETTIERILEEWKNLGLDFKGWSGWKQLRQYLEKRGYNVYLRRAKDLERCANLNAYYILRVQWIGEKENISKPFYGWGHWTEASAHTHFIVLKGKEFFCNEEGIFNRKELYNYLDGAVITSIMEVNWDARIKPLEITHTKGA